MKYHYRWEVVRGKAVLQGDLGGCAVLDDVVCVVELIVCASWVP